MQLSTELRQTDRFNTSTAPLLRLSFIYKHLSENSFFSIKATCLFTIAIHLSEPLSCVAQTTFSPANHLCHCSAMMSEDEVALKAIIWCLCKLTDRCGFTHKYTDILMVESTGSKWSFAIKSQSCWVINMKTAVVISTIQLGYTVFDGNNTLSCRKRGCRHEKEPFLWENV